MSIEKAIKAVQQLSSDLAVLPGTPTYDEITKSYFTELERELKPACFLTPRSARDVSDILKTIKPYADGMKLAICCAGQQATPGVANVQDGLTIHLGKIQGVEVDMQKQVVSVAAGERMGNVYEKVMALGLGVVGNRHSSSGIGGDALQGGLSYFSYDRGFICDDVVNYEIVLADGETVNANAEANQDLWVALKGGGNNFGIVTRFTLRVYELKQMWGGKVFYSLPSFPGQIKSLVDYLHDPKPETNIHICLSLGYAAAIGDIICMNDIFCTSPGKPKALAPFADIQPQIDQMNTLRVDSLKGFTDEAFTGATSNRVVKLATTVRANASILEYAVETFRGSFEKLLTFEPIPMSMIEQSIARGENALGLEPSDGPLVVILFYTSWDNSGDDKKIYDANINALKTIDLEAESKGLAVSYRYLNYAFIHQDAFGSYGEESEARLMNIRERYDPEGFFSKSRYRPVQIFRVKLRMAYNLWADHLIDSMSSLPLGVRYGLGSAPKINICQV